MAFQPNIYQGKRKSEDKKKYYKRRKQQSRNRSYSEDGFGKLSYRAKQHLQ